MAQCNMKISDDLLDKDTSLPLVNHNLKEVVAFSSTKNQMCLSRKKEGLIVKGKDGKYIDRRILVDFSDSKFGVQKSYRMLCQLTARIPNGQKMVGSCFKIHRNNKEYIVTCAHNIVGWSILRKKFYNFKWHVCYEMRQGESSWMKCHYLDASKLRVHPKHNRDGDSGYDVAVCSQGEIVSKGKNNGAFVKYHGTADVLMHPCDPKNLKVGMSVEVAGYPGEKLGQPHTHTGVIVGWVKAKAGGYVLLYDVDCTCGNSGSPIMITDEEYLKKQNASPGVKKIIIGIHTGHDELEGHNYGTLITPSLEKWINGQDYQDEKKELDDLPDFSTSVNDALVRRRRDYFNNPDMYKVSRSAGSLFL